MRWSLPLLLIAAVAMPGCVCYRNAERAGAAGDEVRSPTLVLTAADVEGWYRSRAAWRMPEEAFHFIADLVAEHGTAAHVVAGPDAIAALRRLRGVFPASSLVRAELRGRRLTVGFDGDRNATVGTALGQVALAFSREVEFDIEPLSAIDAGELPTRSARRDAAGQPVVGRVAAAETDAAPLRLRVVRGGVRVNFGWILRAVAKRQLPDAQLDTIDCVIAPGLRAGRIVGTERFALPRADIAWTRDGDRVVLDLRHDDLPWKDEIVLRAQRCMLWGRPVWRSPVPWWRWRTADGAWASGPEAPPGVVAEPLEVRRVRRGGREVETNAPRDGDEVIDARPLRQGPGRLDPGRAAAALADPEPLLTGGVEATLRLAYEVDNAGMQWVDIDEDLRFPSIGVAR